MAESPIGSRALARFLAALTLWGPLLLWLYTLAPPPPGASHAPHLLTAAALALIGAQALLVLFRVPVAAKAEGRFRVVPRRPHLPALLAGVGVGAMSWGAWSGVTRGVDPATLAAIPSGLLATWIAVNQARDALWGTWMEVAGEALRVHCPRAGDWAIPLSRVVALHRRRRDGSFLVEAPDPDQDVFVPSRRAGARYFVTEQDALFRALERHAPVLDTDLLLAARRG